MRGQDVRLERESSRSALSVSELNSPCKHRVVGLRVDDKVVLSENLKSRCHKSLNGTYSDILHESFPLQHAIITAVDYKALLLLLLCVL